MDRTIDVPKINAAIRAFVQEREWEPFHTPKNLAMALAAEAGELMELFQWLTENESRQIMTEEKSAQRVREELADIFVYLLRVADVLDVDLQSAVEAKMRLNAEKYPVALSKGHARKYTEL